MDELILVDEHDNPIGKLDKTSVHEQGLLHRAFSLFVFNSKGEILLQQRADHKYHSAGLWSNACCSHPRFGEELNTAVQRRMLVEMGMDCDPMFVFSFLYRVEFDNGLVEHEFDHVFFDVLEALPNINLEEVKSYKYLSMDNLEQELLNNPAYYTEWFKLCFPQVRSHYKRIFNA